MGFVWPLIGLVAIGCGHSRLIGCLNVAVTGVLIRPRARYLGPRPEEESLSWSIGEVTRSNRRSIRSNRVSMRSILRDIAAMSPRKLAT